MATKFTLIILYFILAIPLVLVFVARGSDAEVEIDRQEIEEYDLEKSDVAEMPSSGI
jgi:hypothetical protein